VVVVYQEHDDRSGPSHHDLFPDPVPDHHGDEMRILLGVVIVQSLSPCGTIALGLLVPFFDLLRKHLLQEYDYSDHLLLLYDGDHCFGYLPSHHGGELDQHTLDLCPSPLSDAQPYRRLSDGVRQK